MILTKQRSYRMFQHVFGEGFAQPIEANYRSE